MHFRDYATRVAILEKLNAEVNRINLLIKNYKVRLSSRIGVRDEEVLRRKRRSTDASPDMKTKLRS
ncbi:hypothetical protein G293_00260 [Candidatus Liberibacter africanus PTSAPSY]|uniref:Uncharacterized protein n=1 Tax=Candidatus Liberibacter africanus PTSAPSY TaxID=1277257 RepID=A0A0G3I1H5_LIBAF|nr:hypothetical protein G293_00260 [Candidatus Liberibacter africanus PTSAPSY]